MDQDKSIKKNSPSPQSPPLALITGSGDGIGRALALALAAQGYTIIVNYRRREKITQATADRIRQDGGQAEIYRADVTIEAEVAKMFAFISQKYRRLDVLINNVGDFLRKDLSRLTIADIQRITASNYFSFAACSLQAARLMRPQRQGRIINIGYVYAERLQANPAVAAYHAAKQAMMSLSFSLAKNLARHHITVNVVSPGININSVDKPKTPGMIIPFGRLGRYSDLVNAVLFLLKPESEYITGSHIKVSGGHGL